MSDASETNSHAAKPAPNEFGSLIRQMRRQLGWSQAKLAEAAGFRDSYISMLERGERGKMLNRDTVYALANALQASPDERNRLLVATELPIDGRIDGPTFEQYVSRDPALRPEGRRVLIELYKVLTGPPPPRRR